MPKSRSQRGKTTTPPSPNLPDRVPVMPVKSTVLFPTGATGLQVGFSPNVAVLTAHPDKNLGVGLVYSCYDEMPIDPASLQ